MSDTNRRFSLALDSRLEFNDEVTAPPPQPRPASPTIGSILADIGPVPREALFLGQASDGLPVLLNLHEPAPGPMLVIGETGSGKTTFLHSIAHSLVQTHQANDLQYGVVTSRLDEWEGRGNNPHCAGTFSTNDTGAQDLIHSMATWAHENKNARQSLLLLVDDLEAIARLEIDALQDFRWLLARGPSRRVWPIITMDAERYGQVLAWIPIFRTRIFGRIKNEHIANALGGDKISALDTLEAPNQFSLRENGGWIRFKKMG